MNDLINVKVYFDDEEFCYDNILNVCFKDNLIILEHDFAYKPKTIINCDYIDSIVFFMEKPRTVNILTHIVDDSLYYSGACSIRYDCFNYSFSISCVHSFESLYLDIIDFRYVLF